MHYAIVDARRVEATPKATGRCPICDSEVVARCGEINVWHWAHRRADCDSWAEGEGEWHLEWKRRFPKQWREFVIENHRADIKSPRGVVELQASSISTAQVAERETFYGEMIWLVDASRFDLDIRPHENYVTFRWKHPRKTWWYTDRPLFFDLGNQLILKVRRIHPETPCGGSGEIISYEMFIEQQSRPKQGDALCGDCKMPSLRTHMIETGMWEYCTLDVDPQTLLCTNCHESRCDARTPDDPELFDCWTPVRIG